VARLPQPQKHPLGSIPLLFGRQPRQASQSFLRHRASRHLRWQCSEVVSYLRSQLQQVHDLRDPGAAHGEPPEPDRPGSWPRRNRAVAKTPRLGPATRSCAAGASSRISPAWASPARCRGRSRPRRFPPVPFILANHCPRRRGAGLGSQGEPDAVSSVRSKQEQHP